MFIIISNGLLLGLQTNWLLGLGELLHDSPVPYIFPPF